MTEEEATKSEQGEVAGEAEDVEALKKALGEARARADANLAGWQRAQADFINYKRRCEQDKEETGKSANATLILSLLPVIDDLERALSSIPPEVAKKKWADGIRLIERKCKAYLEAQGLASITANGQPFDPKFHEAMKQDKGKEGMVIQELEKGYMLRDRVLRPSKVIVGNGETEGERNASSERHTEEEK